MRSNAMLRRTLSVIAALAAVLASQQSAQAAAVSYIGTSGSLKAEADFTLSGTTLTVVLTNLGAAAKDNPDVLTGLLFNSSHNLTPVSAAFTAGSGFNAGATPSTGTIGDGWQLRGQGAPAGTVSMNGFNAGLAAAGFSPNFDPQNSSFSSVNSGQNTAVDYGIINKLDANATNGLKSHGPLADNSVTFTITVGAGFTLSELGNVEFLYGTAASGEPTIPNVPPNVVPEPTSIALVGMSILGMAGYGWRRRKA